MLKEEGKLMVSENGMLRRICRPQKWKVTGGCENYAMRSYLYYSPFIIRVIKSRIVGGSCSTHKR
jgi:hypothetical protein